MSRQEIRESLERLKAEVNAMAGSHAPDKERVAALVKDLERQLGEPGDLDHAGMIDQIEDTVTALEVEHPAITGILNGIATTLSNYGI